MTPYVVGERNIPLRDDWRNLRILDPCRISSDLEFNRFDLLTPCCCWPGVSLTQGINEPTQRAAAWVAAVAIYGERAGAGTKTIGLKSSTKKLLLHG